MYISQSIMFLVLEFCCLCLLFISPLTQGVHIITRQAWRAREPAIFSPIRPKFLPVPYVVIHHSAANSGCNGEECVTAVRGYQNYHMDQLHFEDIGYNFVVSPEGKIFEGRGWGVIGAHTYGYNVKSIGICVIGNYMEDVPTQGLLKAIQDLIQEGVETNEIHQNYVLIGGRQVIATLSPGDKLYDIIKTWPHWAQVN